MSERGRTDLSHSRQLLQLAGPLIFSNLAYTLLGALDTIFMGRVGPTELGAVGVASALFLAASVLLRGTVGSVMVVVSQAYGAGDTRRIRQAFQQYIVLALLLAPFSLAMPGFFAVFFRITKPQAAVRVLALRYISIRAYEIPFSLISKAMVGFLLGIGNSKVPMLVSWITVAVNMVANYILVFGKLGFPRMELAGAAWGTVVSQVVQVTLFLFFVFRLYGKELGLARDFHIPSWSQIKAMLKLGFPMGLADSVDLSAFGIFMTFLARLGTIELAASQVANQLNDIAFMPSFAIGMATSSLVGRSLGEGSAEKAEKYGSAGLRVGVLLMGTLGLCYWLFPGLFVMPFTSDLQVSVLSRKILRIVAVYQLTDVIRIVFCGILNGAGQTRFTGFTTLASACLIFIPATYIGAFVLGFGVWGAWVGPLTHAVLLMIIFGIRFRNGKWKEADTIKLAADPGQ